MPLGEILRRIDTLQQSRRAGVTNLVDEVGQDEDFWTKTRGVQISRMLLRNEAHGVMQKEIAIVLGVSKGLVTRKKRKLQKDGLETSQSPGKPSQLSVVFPLLENFIRAETRAKRAVTMGVVMAFVSERIPNHQITRKTLYTFMKRHGYAYKWTDTTDAPRADVKANDIINFYTRTLPEAVNGTHPSLVFNMDEMGAEMFADRKGVFVFVHSSQTTRNTRPTIGVPRSPRRCTLVGCISADGTRLCHGIITKTVTISSLVFAEGGWTSERLKIHDTENSFINNDVFGKWICEILLPEIERRRAWLRETLGAFNERAVLILDGLKVHTMEPFVELLRRYNVTMVVLVAHTSHMTQPLDVGIFWRVKNLMREANKYIINLHQLDRELAHQEQEENARRPVPPERGRLLADYIVNILRSYEQATTGPNIVSAFAQVGIHSKMVDQANTDNRVVYVDPSTARVVVDNFGVIPLPDELRVQPSPTWQLKISDLNSAHQSPMAQQLSRELAAIREELPPQTRRRLSIDAKLTYRDPARAPRTRASRARAPRPAAPHHAPAAPLPPPLAPARPAALPRGPRSAFRRASCLPYANTHSDGGFEILLGSGDSPQSQGRGLFKPVGYFLFSFWF